MKIFKTLASAAAGLALLGGWALAAEGQKDAKDVSYSFEGPFGRFDKGQLQRGYKVYKESCAQCHAMKYVSFRNLAEEGGPGFSEDEVKALAATFTVNDGPGEDGEMFERPGLPSDRFPSPFANEKAAANANGGAVPPDLSLITKARAGWYGTFNQFIHGIGGPEYVYSVVTGFEEPPAELKAEQPEGKYYNPYFASGHWISMAPPLVDGQVTFDDGKPNTVADMARDVSAFLAWTAEPKLEERKSMGFMTMIYLGVLALLLYLVKKKIWARVH
ncbi:MAG: cytochrome c1 [Rhizobiales bacterium]|nr:cytochrome c1 [Hyphomicrobiales bacterium]